VVEVNSLPLDSLPSGDYFVVIRAYNGLARSATDSITVMRAFSVSNPEMDSSLRASLAAANVPPPMQTDMIDPIYAGKKESELDEEYAKVRFIASDAEKTMWSNMSGVEAKGRFLSRFWSVRDQTPGTPENEERDAYYKRVEEARSMYSAPMSPKGWDSDRGRVLLQFGKPDGIDRHVHDFNRKPYEVWTYTNLGYEFAFVDRTQTGFYRLVHSTAPGEVRFENWEVEYTKLSKNWKDKNDE
jgi:GWxTD domain-containing protein